MTLARVLRGIRDPLDAGYVLGRVKGRGPPQPIKLPLGVITPHGTANVQPGNAELTALAALSGTGLVVRTAAATYAVRTLVAGTGISITNPDGVAGNVTINATGGTGTVTTVSVVTANGASGSVANPTTTPAITLSFATQATSDNSTKVATTAYVTTAIANAVAGVNPAVTVQAATTAAANTSGFTYNNGVAGIGATLTGSVNTAVTIDGYTFTALGQRLLVKNDTQSPSGAFNGVYYVTQIQTVLLPPILTRALDYDMPSDINNTGAIPVVNGTVNALTSWLLTSTVTTVGTDPLTYTQFSYAAISAANPTATASDTAVNGSAATFMRSDAAPAIQKTSSSVFGVAKVDGTTITAAAGVISAVGGGPSVYPAFTAPVNGDFAWVNQGGASVTVNANGGICLYGPAVGSTSLRIREEATLAAPYTVTAAFLPNIMAQNNTACGLCIRDSVGGKIVAYQIFSDQTFTDNGFVLGKYNDATTFSSSAVISGALTAPSLVYLRLTDNNTNRIWSISKDGYNFIPIHTEGRTTFLTANKVGFFVNPQNGTYDVALTLLSWLVTTP